MAEKLDVYQIVTDSMVEALTAGVVPWQKPWTGGEAGMPRSLNGNRPYRGVNVFLLALTAQAKGYSSPYWTTYKHAQTLGGTVRKGEKSTLVVLYDFVPVKGPDGKPALTSKGTPKRRPILKYYRVFNVEQCDGLKLPKYAEPKVIEALDWSATIEAAEAIIDNMPNRPSIGYGGGSAFYVPSQDHVQLPERERFASREAFYGTAFHELTHSTANETRLNRETGEHKFGSHDYGREELIAEMGSAFLSAIAGIEVTHDNSAAYLGHWIGVIQEDPRAVVVAASAAQKAADYILDRAPAHVETHDQEAA